MEKPPIYVKKGKEHQLCQLKKDIYGIKKAPTSLYEKNDRYFLNIRFERSLVDSNFYIQVFDSKSEAFMVLYVDDFLITGNDTIMISNLNKDLQMNLKMTYLGLIHYFLRV